MASNGLYLPNGLYPLFHLGGGDGTPAKQALLIAFAAEADEAKDP